MREGYCGVCLWVESSELWSSRSEGVFPKLQEVPSQILRAEPKCLAWASLGRV